MGNFKFGYNFVDYTPTPSSEISPYLATNLKLYDCPKQHWRTNSVVTNTTIVFNYGSAKSIVGIVLVDVNFAACYIQANATDSWGSPSYRLPAVSGNLTVTKDSLYTQRYNIFIPTVFNLQYSRLYIPTQTPVDGAAYFRIGTVVHLNTILELSQNPNYDDEEFAEKKIETNEFRSGGFEDIILGDRIWERGFDFEVHPTDYINDLKILNGIDIDQNLILYENFDDTSRVYVCRRRTPIKISHAGFNYNRIPTIYFKEMR